MNRFDGYVIVDLDGCLSDDRWRRHLLPPFGSAPDAYDEYHRLAAADSVVTSVVNDVLFDAHDEYGVQRSMILVVTSRPDRRDYRAKTLGWIRAMVTGDTEFDLLMRPAEDRSPSAALKMRLLNAYFMAMDGAAIRGWERVVSAYDDRLDVLEALPIPESCKFCRALEEPPEELPEAAPDTATLRVAADVLRATADELERRIKA